MQTKYPHRKKWLISNLKGKPGKRPLGSFTARRKPTQTSTLIVYCPRPIQGRETQHSQHTALVRRNLTPWPWQVQALVTTHLTQAAAGPGQPLAQVIGGIFQYKAFRRTDCRSNPGYCACSRALSSSSRRSSRGKGTFTVGPFQDLQALSHHEQ